VTDVLISGALLAAMTAALAVVLWVAFHGERVLRSRMRDRVVITTKTGATYVGVLFEQDRRSLVLRQTVAVGAADDRSDVNLDGELILLWADVDFVQRP